MIEILAATTNRGKVREIEALFVHSALQVKLYFLPDFNIAADCPETGRTFLENAIAKSLFYSKFVPGIYTIADDSGLAVEALAGAPGIYSSRYSGPGATDEKNIAKLLEQLKDIKNRKARFVTTVCLSKNGQIIKTFTGEVEGIIIDEKRGSGGFGYDPVFYYPPLKKTFAQLSTEEKNRISHRARAFQKLKEFLESGLASGGSEPLI
jgi:XTP/dITP diphosphohydrolase